LHFNQLNTTMKAPLLLPAALVAITTSAQEPTPQASYTMRYQQCPWKDVVVVRTGNPAAVNTTTVGLFTLPKTSTRKTFTDLTEEDLRKVKKAAHRMHTCLVTVDDDYHTPKQIKDSDLKKEAELNAQILFYFKIPYVPIDRSCELPPYHKRAREKWQAARSAQ